MLPSDKFYALIEKFEGFVPCPYLDGGGVPTIGIGSTFYENGKKVTMKDPCITHDRAVVLLSHVVNQFAESISKLIKVKLNSNQFDSLLSLAYNIGVGAFSKSTILKKINANPLDPTIKAAFESWRFDNGKMIPGLLKRRRQEWTLYFSVEDW